MFSKPSQSRQSQYKLFVYPDNMPTHALKTAPGWGACFRAPAHQLPADFAAGVWSAAVLCCFSCPSAGTTAPEVELAEMNVPTLAQMHFFCNLRLKERVYPALVMRRWSAKGQAVKPIPTSIRGWDYELWGQALAHWNTQFSYFIHNFANTRQK